MKQSIFSKSSLIIGLLLLLALFSQGSFAQKSNRLKKKSPKTLKTRVILPKLEPVYQSGDVNINVRSMTDRTIKLGLSPGGVTLVEFPADDFVFARHPGDENFVTIDKDIIARNNPTDPLVFRPGKGFFVSKENHPSAQITIQMTSGAVFTFQIYAVKELSKSATRVQLIYQPNEIIAERERLGLPTELQIKREIPQTRKVVETAQTAQIESVQPKPEENPTSQIEASEKGTEKLSSETLDNVKSLFSVEDFAKKLVSEASNYKWKFGLAKNGLSLAAQPSSLVENGKYRLDLVAVKNNLKEPISLVDLPSLVIETFEKKGGKGNALNQEVYPLKSIIHNLPADKILMPNTVYYFAVIADYPVILGVNQELKISVAQTNAADDPAVLSLLISAR